MERLPRAAIREAAYNPRTIDRSARKRLRESLGRGLVEPLVWNKRTGNLVSGHQRISLLDEDAGGTDYSLDVAVVDLDEADERALNVRLNNPSAMGSYDFDGLQKLLTDDAVKIDPKALGFDEMDLQALFPEAPKVGEDLFGKDKDETAQMTIDEMKSWKKEKKAKDAGEDRADFYVAFVARDGAQVAAFLEKWGLEPEQMFHPLEALELLLAEEASPRGDGGREKGVGDLDVEDA